jgi:hypothetical protein
VLLLPVDPVGMGTFYIVAHPTCREGTGVQLGPFEVTNPDTLAPLGDAGQVWFVPVEVFEGGDCA